MSATAIIPTDQPSVFDTLNSLTTLQQQAIVRPQNPPPGLAGFLFDIPDDDEINLRSSITDSYVEANYAIQDHIALPPETYTLRGLVAELTAMKPPPNANQASVPNPLPDAAFLAPTLSPQATATQAATVAAKTQASNAATSSQSLYDYYNANVAPPPNQTKQAKILNYLYQLWWGRQLVTVETPWGFLTNMAIELVKGVQGTDSRFYSTLTVTFKKIRTVQTITVNVGQLAGRAASQMAPTVNQGNTTGTPVSTEQQSILFNLLNPGS